MKLNRAFFNHNTIVVARDLLGKFLVRRIGKRIVRAMITETEAYHGPHDRASHASKGMTKRTRVMFGPPGMTYVYLIYGMYHCLNFVTMHEKFPAAVLIRGVDTVDGLPRTKSAPSVGGQRNNLVRGPGKVCKLMQIDRKLNNVPVGNRFIWIEDRGVHVQKRNVETLKRVGVDYAGPWRNKLWRFRMKVL